MTHTQKKPYGALPRAGIAVAAFAVLAAAHAVPVRAGDAQPERPAPRKRVTLEELSARSPTEGLRGTMHGVNPRLGTYVFTWWNPASFFESFNFSLVPANGEIAAGLASLERHQEVLVRGRLVRSPAAQPHLQVEALEPGKKWDPGVKEVEPMERPEGMERWLRGRKQLQALVHATSDDGSMLALELRGEVVPVQVPEAHREAVKALYRGDRIQLRYRIAEHPARPLHLQPDASGGEGTSIQVLDAIKTQHEQTRTVEGLLVVFPRSPALRRTIWGVEDRGPNGLHRYFTIFNFTDLKDQDKIDALLKGAWDGEPRGVKDARNKYVHTGVRVRVTGKVSNPAPNQANPTLVTTSDQVRLAR